MPQTLPGTLQKMFAGRYKKMLVSHTFILNLVNIGDPVEDSIPCLYEYY